MAYVICLNPEVKLDLMVRKEHQAELVSYFARCGCAYKKEKETTFPNGETWVTFKDIYPAHNGRELGDLIGLFYSMEWKNLIEGQEDKYYILINRRRGKKYAGKNRKEVRQRSESGDAGEPDTADRHNEPDGDGGEFADAGNPGDYDLRTGEESAPAGDCGCQ